MWNTRSLEQAHRNGKHSLFMQFHLCCTCDDRSECLLSLWPLTIRYCNQNILLWCLLFTVKVVFSCNVVTLKSYLMNLYCNCLKRAIKFFKKNTTVGFIPEDLLTYLLRCLKNTTMTIIRASRTAPRPAPMYTSLSEKRTTCLGDDASLRTCLSLSYTHTHTHCTYVHSCLLQDVPFGLTFPSKIDCGESLWSFSDPLLFPDRKRRARKNIYVNLVPFFSLSLTVFLLCWCFFFLPRDVWLL